MYADTCRCKWGALSPPAVWPQGVLFFIRVRTPNLTYTRRHPTDWLISNFLIVLIGDIIFLSVCQLLWCILHKWYSHAPQPCAPTVDHQPTTKSRIRQACFLFFTTTSTLMCNPITTDSYFWLWTDPHRTQMQRSPKGSPLFDSASRQKNFSNLVHRVEHASILSCNCRRKPHLLSSAATSSQFSQTEMLLTYHHTPRGGWERGGLDYTYVQT